MWDERRAEEQRAADYALLQKKNDELQNKLILSEKALQVMTSELVVEVWTVSPKDLTCSSLHSQGSEEVVSNLTGQVGANGRTIAELNSQIIQLEGSLAER